MNLVLLVGRASTAAVTRTLPSGDTLAEIQLTIPRRDGPADSVPVVVFSPRLAVTRIGPGTEVVVRGRVRRRFFQAGGALASRTEVVADDIAPTSERRRAERVTASALGEIQAVAIRS